MKNAITIDVEDYFMVSAFSDVVRYEDWGRYESRVEANTMRVLDLLERHGVMGTFFILGWVAERFPGLVRAIHGRGHEVGSHGYSHSLVFDMTRVEFRDDVSRSRKILEDITGEAVQGYRAASFSITPASIWALDILMEEGYRYDSSIFPVRHITYGHPDFSRFPTEIETNGAGSILEIPLSTVRLFGKNIPIAGGGYMRLFPLKFLQWGIRTINREESQPAVIYFHPWEIDPGQPRLNGSRLSMFRHRVNLEKTLSKLDRLLRAFEFAPVREVFSERLSGAAGKGVYYA